MRIALGIEYDGRPYSGWQAQPSGNTIQDLLEAAIARLAGHTVRLHAAGRTDAGVHATLQIAHFDTTTHRPLSAWVRGVNAFLPESIAVLWSRQMPDVDDDNMAAFHARFSATARHYQYRLLNRPVRPAVLAGKVGWFHAPLNMQNMQAAAGYLIGEHDFSSFRAADCQAKSPIKILTRFELRREAELIISEISASGFLHHMIRNIMGALVHIGKGSADPAWMYTLLMARNRQLAPPTFMADGLYFAGASYTDAFGFVPVALPPL